MKLINMLPFLDDAEKKELVASILNHEIDEEDFPAIEIVPFLEGEDVLKLFQAALEGKINCDPCSFLPFLEKKELDALVERIQSGSEEKISIEMVMPFLESDQVKSIFNLVLDSLKKKKE